MVWAIIGIGITGPAFYENGIVEVKYFATVSIVLIYLLGNHFLNESDRRFSYIFRRFSSLTLGLVCLLLTAYSFWVHKKFLIYTISFYYMMSSMSYFALLTRIVDPVMLYKLHDWIIGHFLFIWLYVLSILMLGVLQTWLLYYDALSSGVAIQDILKYASRRKDGNIDTVDNVAANELRYQVMENEKTLHRLLRVASEGGFDKKLIRGELTSTYGAVPLLNDGSNFDKENFVFKQPDSFPTR